MNQAARLTEALNQPIDDNGPVKPKKGSIEAVMLRKKKALDEKLAKLDASYRDKKAPLEAEMKRINDFLDA